MRIYNHRIDLGTSLLEFPHHVRRVMRKFAATSEGAISLSDKSFARPFKGLFFQYRCRVCVRKCFNSFSGIRIGDRYPCY